MKSSCPAPASDEHGPHADRHDTDNRHLFDVSTSERQPTGGGRCSRSRSCRRRLLPTVGRRNSRRSRGDSGGLRRASRVAVVGLVSPSRSCEEPAYRYRQHQPQNRTTHCSTNPPRLRPFHLDLLHWFRSTSGSIRELLATSTVSHKPFSPRTPSPPHSSFQGIRSRGQSQRSQCPSTQTQQPHNSPLTP